MNFYNEYDKKAAAWLRQLIADGIIPPGTVDERSITDLIPSDLDGFTQCHFFAGIGGWPFALQLAGWPADRPVWTGSCPCQPFSAAGQGKGTADERHLWPAFFALIQACRPPIVFGEQVASAAVIGSSAKPPKRGTRTEIEQVWLDGVCADLEAAHYSAGAGDIPAAGIGAPHIRQRLYWVADSQLRGCERIEIERSASIQHTLDGKSKARFAVSAYGASIGGMADPIGGGERGRDERRPGEGREQVAQQENREDTANEPGDGREDAGGMDDTQRIGRGEGRGDDPEHVRIITDATIATGGVGNPSGRGCRICGHETQQGSCGHPECPSGPGYSGVGDSILPRLEGLPGDGDHGHESGRIDEGAPRPTAEAGTTCGMAHAPLPEGARLGALREQLHRPTNWDRFNLLPCRDGKTRRVESGTFPLAYGVSGRVGLLRGYGNAIVPQAAAEFVLAYLETKEIPFVMNKAQRAAAIIGKLGGLANTPAQRAARAAVARANGSKSKGRPKKQPPAPPTE